MSLLLFFFKLKIIFIKFVMDRCEKGFLFKASTVVAVKNLG